MRCRGSPNHICNPKGKKLIKNYKKEIGNEKKLSFNRNFDHLI